MCEFNPMCYPSEKHCLSFLLFGLDVVSVDIRCDLWLEYEHEHLHDCVSVRLGL